MQYHTIHPGDKVTWAYLSKQPGVISLTQKSGIVETIQGDKATVRQPSQQTTIVPLAGLLVEGAAKPQLTQFVEEVLERSRQK